MLPHLKPLPEETRSFPLLTPARSFVDRWDDLRLPGSPERC